MTKQHVKTAAEIIKKLEEKDGEANNESARTNELLAARAGVGKDSDPVKESLALNDPSLTRAAHTSHKSGFNEDLEHPDVKIPGKKGHGQTKTVDK